LTVGSLSDFTKVDFAILTYLKRLAVQAVNKFEVVPRVNSRPLSNIRGAVFFIV